MGEAQYYLKARFASEEEAANAYPGIVAFIKEGRDASEWWGKHRGDSPSEFWPKFGGLFPTVAKYLDGLGLSSDDCNNSLSDKLDFGQDEEPYFNWDLLLFSAYVWHFADWSGFCEFLKSHFGAVASAWLSEEWVDLSDLLVV